MVRTFSQFSPSRNFFLLSMWNPLRLSSASTQPHHTRVSYVLLLLFHPVCPPFTPRVVSSSNFCTVAAFFTFLYLGFFNVFSLHTCSLFLTLPLRVTVIVILLYPRLLIRFGLFTPDMPKPLELPSVLQQFPRPCPAP